MAGAEYLSKIRSLGLKEAQLADPNFNAIIEYAGLKPGMGLTVGNALRRVLLSSIAGYAIRNVTISGVQHEFSSIPGVKEDAQQLIMNLKKIVFKGEISKTKIALNVMGGCIVTGKNLSCSNVEVVNQDAYICALDKGFNLKLEMTLEKSVGIKLSSEVKDYDIELGAIACDSFFSPIESVNFEVVAREDGYEDLRLQIVTNGSISSQEAFDHALSLLQDQLGKHSAENNTKQTVAIATGTKRLDVLSPNLFLKIEDLPDMSVRILRCLKLLGVVYVGDLVKMSSKTLMKEPNFGENSLNKLMEKLAPMGLSLDMEIPGWPPENLASKAEEIGSKSIL